jgi:hypothetical protein
MAQENAIQKEVAKLDQHWQEFTAGDHAILHWMIKATDVALANAFVKVKERFDQQNGEWFIQLTGEFVGKHMFAGDLANELYKLMDEGLAEVYGETLLEDWRKINLDEAQSGFHALFIVCGEILRLFGKNFETLTLVVNPTAVEKPREYAQWWELACDIHRNYREWDPKLKLLVLDSAEKPFLEKSFADNADVALSQTPPLDFNGAARAIAEQANDGSDSGQFRVHLLDLNNAIGEQNKKQIDQASAAALAIAEKNSWFDMWATVLMTRGAGWLNFKVFDQAVKDYRQAQQVAIHGIDQQTPGCEKVLLQAILFEGTAYFLADYLEHAAQAFVRAAKKAEEFNDAWVRLEGWRMASLSMENHKQKEMAWQYASEALVVGREMSAETCQQSTLAFVGQAMLRLSPNSQVKSEVKNAFDQLLGKEWLAQVEAVTT